MNDRTPFRQRLSTLLKSNNAPHEIALGVAIGVFIGIMPLYGFHTLLFMLAAFLIPRVNKIAIFLGTNISLPLTAPFITWAGYTIGRGMLRGGYPALNMDTLRHLKLEDIPRFFTPLFFGSLLLGAGAAVVFYVITLLVARKVKKT